MILDWVFEERLDHFEPPGEHLFTIAAGMMVLPIMNQLVGQPD
jgi:hypothetical protein